MTPHRWRLRAPWWAAELGRTAWDGPALVLALAAIGADRAAFTALRGWVRLLVEIGARDLACRTIDRAMKRCEDRRREASRRWG